MLMFAIIHLKKVLWNMIQFCKPGFDKNKIAIQFDGIDQMEVNDKGILSLKTSVGEVTFPEPNWHQTVNEKSCCMLKQITLLQKTMF